MDKECLIRLRCDKVTFFDVLLKELKSEKKQEKYSFEKKIGNGAQGVVYKAFSSKLLKHVAIKKMVIESLDQSNKTLEEFNIISKLNHKNLCKYIDIFQEMDGETLSMCFVMPLYNGDFDSIVNSGLTEYEMWIYLEQIVDGVLFLHSNDVIHRDLKPGNLLLCKDDLNLKITDFGVSIHSSMKTLHQTIIGTSLYAAPEVMRGKPYNSSVDIYSIGAIMYRMVMRTDRILWGDLMDDEDQTHEDIRKEFAEKKISEKFTNLTLMILRKVAKNRPTLEKIKEIIRS